MLDLFRRWHFWYTFWILFGYFWDSFAILSRKISAIFLYFFLCYLSATSWYFLVLVDTYWYFLVFLVHLCTSWYCMVLLGTSCYFLVLLVLLGTSCYFLVPSGACYLLATSCYFFVLLGPIQFCRVLFSTFGYFWVLLGPFGTFWYLWILCGTFRYYRVALSSFDWIFPSFDWKLALLYWIVQPDFTILFKEFGTDCLGLVLYMILKNNHI